MILFLKKWVCYEPKLSLEICSTIVEDIDAYFEIP